MKIRKICFDLDDTLIPNTYKYHGPTWKCGMLIDETLGHKSMYPPDLLKFQLEIDMGMVKEINPATGEPYGFNPSRFPTGWVKTYELLAARAGLPVDPEICKRLHAMASEFRQGPFRLYRGADAALSRLKDMVDEMHLITAGDQELQQQKIDECGAAEWFDTVRITPMKKKDILAEIAAGRPDECMMVGDSKKSDIVPAVELGLHAVWIPSQTWSFADADVDASKYHQLKDITELPDLIRRLG